MFKRFHQNKGHRVQRRVDLLSRRRLLRAEQLETRQVLATFGTPWPDARGLTLSFPTDSAQIGAYNNSIRYSLDQVTDRLQWQEAVLRAFQTWAVQTNINIGLVEDRGDAFGAIGLSQKDPRFGDIRVGAFPQVGVLANALPFQTSAGTWSGDVLLNTQTNYFLGDWFSGSPIQVPAPDAKGPAIELFSVLLHEAGNALGLPDVNRPGTVMHQTYQRPLGRLTSTDVAAIRSLYGGPRVDLFETISNNSRGTATRIQYPTGFDGKSVVSIKGSLNTIADVDHYRFTPLSGRDTVTVRLRAAGISLLKSHLSVLDASGNVLADVKADSITANDLELEIGSLRDHRQLFIRVDGNGNDLFTIGDYQLELDYRPKQLQPVIEPIVFDADAVDEDEPTYFSPAETVDAIFSKVGLVDQETNVNNTLATATPLTSALGYLAETRYEYQAALTQGDVDHYRFRTPQSLQGAVSVELEAVGRDTPILRADVLDLQGRRVQARALPRPDGSVTFVLANPQPATEYVIRVRTAPTSVVKTGNYVLTVNVATEQASMVTVASGTVAATRVTWIPVRAYKTQLFRFDLQAISAVANRGIVATIYNAKTANAVGSFSAVSGQTMTDFVWLQQGDYFVRLESVAQPGTQLGSMQYVLQADGISDDQGPLPVDPTDPYGGFDPVPDPYGGMGAEIVPLPNPNPRTTPFLPDPNPVPDPVPDPYGGQLPYERPPIERPWYLDLYYRYYNYWQYG